MWQTGSPGWLSALPVLIVGFIGIYALCYIYHEWGHYLGARLAQVNMPLAPYKGILLGYFDNSSNSREAFLSMSWGGVIGYSSVTAICVVLHLNIDSLMTAAMLVGGLAFLVQSLSVDLPQIIRVRRGGNHANVNADGTQPALILKRTWQSWLVLGVLVFAWNL